jgi:cysteine-rich repeat protein
MRKLLFISFILILVFPIIRADIISLNVGGDKNLVINPDAYIEGFFTGGVVTGIECGNGIIETGEQCDDGNTVSGDGCSSTCTTEVVTPPGNGGGGGTPVVTNISVAPTQFNINLVLNTNIQETIRVTNNGRSTVTVSVNQLNLDNMVILENSSLRVEPGETVNLGIIFVALSEPGIFTGKIIIGGEEVLVAINVRTRLLLFDTNIVVLNKDYKVPQGDELKTQVALVPLGDPERLDVTLNYEIKDYEGKTYLTKSETLLIEERLDFRRDFDTGILPLGSYIVGLELVYPNGVAPSSAHFDVTIGRESIFGKLVLYLIVLILLIAIFIVAILIIRHLNKKRESESVGTVVQPAPTTPAAPTTQT